MSKPKKKLKEKPLKLAKTVSGVATFRIGVLPAEPKEDGKETSIKPDDDGSKRKN